MLGLGLGLKTQATHENADIEFIMDVGWSNLYNRYPGGREML